MSERPPVGEDHGVPRPTAPPDSSEPAIAGAWREPAPEPERELVRRLRERDRRVPWVRIVILVVALLGILVFHQTLSDKVVGCYGQYVEPAGGSGGTPAEPTLRIEPARPLPSGSP